MFITGLIMGLSIGCIFGFLFFAMCATAGNSCREIDEYDAGREGDVR